MGHTDLHRSWEERRHQRNPCRGRVLDPFVRLSASLYFQIYIHDQRGLTSGIIFVSVALETSGMVRVQPVPLYLSLSPKLTIQLLHHQSRSYTNIKSKSNFAAENPFVSRHYDKPPRSSYPSIGSTNPLNVEVASFASANPTCFP